jgi:hypothetical protein
MKEYFLHMKNGSEAVRPARKIIWGAIDIDQIAVENHAKWAGLQISDCIVSAYFSAVEPNVYGNSETKYAEILKPRLIRHNGAYLNCGLTVVPSIGKSGLNQEQEAFFNSFK